MRQATVNTVLASSPAERALLWRQDKRIVPLAAGIYFLCYLDRSNIGNAKVLNTSTDNDMQTETGMTNYQFNIALMIFLIGCEWSGSSTSAYLIYLPVLTCRKISYSRYRRISCSKSCAHRDGWLSSW